MDLALSEDQQSIKEAFANFFAKESPPEKVREAEPIGFDDTMWRRLVDTGAVAMGVPEAAGGGGSGLLDVAIVVEEFGRRVAPVPLVEAAVAARLLSNRPTPAGDWLARAVDGQALVTLALHPAIDGVARLAPAGAVADGLIALDGDDLVVAAIPHDGLPPSPSNLGSSPIADRDVRNADRTVLATGDEARALLSNALAEWKALTGATLVGVAAAALDLAVDYVKARHQFGVPIGSFQAVQHRLADVATAVDGARLLAYEAAWAADEGLAEAARLASMTYVFASETAAESTAASLHFHGGYGFMLEYDIQLYFRRAKAWALLYDDPQREYQRLADELFGPRRIPA